MDHLPYPLDHSADCPHLTVPLLIPSSTVVDVPRDHITSSWRFPSPSFTTSVRLKELLVQAQYWLYFGLISYCIRGPVSINDFSSGRGQRRILDTRTLPALLYKHRDDMRPKAIEKTLCDVQKELSDFFRRINSMPSNERTRYFELAQLIILSIRVLTDTIRRQSRNEAEDCDLEFSRDHGKFIDTFARTELDFPILSDRITSKAWCPSKVAAIFQQFTTSTVYYLSAIPRDANTAISHERCTVTACKVLVKEDDYHQVHTHDCDGNCKPVGPAIKEVMDKLKAGGIPVLRLLSDDIVVESAQYGLPYVAISHIWAGGLGDPSGNRLPMCQLRSILQMVETSRQASTLRPGLPSLRSTWTRLKNIVQNSETLISGANPQRFWIDTLCIPKKDRRLEHPEPTDEAFGGHVSQFSSEYEAGIMASTSSAFTPSPESLPLTRNEVDSIGQSRTRAIDRMIQTYAAADSVVVIDPELRRQSRPTGAFKFDDLLLWIFSRIWLSSWTTRCWTFQEAATASELIFKFSDFAFPLIQARYDLIEVNDKRRYKSVFGDKDDMLDELSTWISRLPTFRSGTRFPINQRKHKAQSQDPDIFTDIWNDLACRTTTRRLDKITILALLTGIRPSDIHRKSPRARLASILKAKRQLPLSLLFQPLQSDEERSIFDRECRAEEEAEVERGRQLESFEEGVTYPLPQMVGRGLLPQGLGWMAHDPEKPGYIYFDGPMLSKGKRWPGMFKLPRDRTYQFGHSYRFKLEYSRLVFEIKLDCVPEGHSFRTPQCQLVLITSHAMKNPQTMDSANTAFQGILLSEHSNKIHKKDGFRKRRAVTFEYLCYVQGSSVKDEPDTTQTEVSQVTRVSNLKQTECRILCDFGNVTPSREHMSYKAKSSDLLMSATITQGAITVAYGAFYMYMMFFVYWGHRAFIPHCYTQICNGECGWESLFACCRIEVTCGLNFTASDFAFFYAFGSLWFSILVPQWRNWSNFKRIKFKLWIEGLDDTDSSQKFLKGTHNNFGANCGIKSTMWFGLACCTSVVVGALFFDFRSGFQAFLTVGAVGLCEQLMAWLIELLLLHTRVLDYFSGRGDGCLRNHPDLWEEFVRPSSFTRFLRGQRRDGDIALV